MAENEESEEPTEDAVVNGTAELIVIDQEDDEEAFQGNRRRAEKATTPQRGMNKKKARFDLTEDSELEEEIVFEDCHSNSSSQNTADSPPAPRRLCETPKPSSNDSLPSKSSEDNSDAPSVYSQPTDKDSGTRTMAEVVTATLRPMQPEATNILKSCRYTAQLLVPPDDEPVQKAASLLREVFKEIQRQAGTQVWLAAWQSREDSLVCKKPKDIPTGMSPDDRDIYTRLFDNYMSLTPDSEKRLFLKVHFITTSPDAVKIPLKDIGFKVETLKERFGFRLNPNPNPCQSAKVTTVGWCFGSVKAMDSETLLKAVRATLKIPDHVALGAQWRTIADQHGKKFPWPKDSTAPRPPQALHIDIEDAYIGVWYPKFAKLWKKGATKKVNYLHVRLVPCFTTQVGKSLTQVQHSGTIYMAQKQAHFVNSHTMRLTNSNILDIDTPIGENKVTLRRYLMMKAPEGFITDRIFISVDKSYRGNDFTLTVPKIYADQAVRVLHNMVPECLHLYGEEAARWFTNIGLMAYQDVKWDPLLNATTSVNDETTNELVEENYFGMGEGWKIPQYQEATPTVAEIEGIGTVTTPGRSVAEILEARAKRGIQDDVSSFGEAFGRSHSGSTIVPPTRQTTTPANTARNRRVGFLSDTPTDKDNNEQLTNEHNGEDDGTISTFGTEATTGSTRRTLRHQVEINNSLRTEGAQIAEERDRLQNRLERLQEQLLRHGINTAQDDNTVLSTSTPDPPSAIRVPPSTGADSAGQKN